MPSSHLILCCPLLLLPPIPPSIRVFSNESTLCMRWPKYWSFTFSIIPSKEILGLISRMDWLDLLAVQGTLKSLLQHHSSKASILWHSAFFTVQLSHPFLKKKSSLISIYDNIKWWSDNSVHNTFTAFSVSSWRMLPSRTLSEGWTQESLKSPFSYTVLEQSVPRPSLIPSAVMGHHLTIASGGGQGWVFNFPNDAKLNKQGDNIQPWRTPFPIWKQSVVPCPVLTVASWPA